MRDNSKTVIALLLVGTMVLAAPATAAPASGGPDIDAETTETTIQSAIQDGDTIEDFNASASARFNYTFTGWNGSSPRVRFLRNDSDYIVHNNESLTNVTRASGGTRWNLTVYESDLAVMEHAAGENVTVDVEAYRNSTLTSANSTYTLYLNTTDNRFVERVGDSDVDTADFVTVNADSGTDLLLATIGENDNTELAMTDRTIDGSNTTGHIVLTNGTVADDFDAATDDHNPIFPFSGGVQDGDIMLSMPMEITAGGTTTAIPVFYKSAPDYWDTDKTYATYEPDFHGEQAVSAHFGDEVDGDDNVDVTSFGATGRSKAFDVYGTRAVTGFDGVLSVQFLTLGFDGFDGNLFAGLPLVVVGLKRRDRRRPPRNGPATASAQAQSQADARMATGGA